MDGVANARYKSMADATFVRDLLNNETNVKVEEPHLFIFM